jgi:hypothetical protein
LQNLPFIEFTLPINENSLDVNAATNAKQLVLEDANELGENKQ